MHSACIHTHPPTDTHTHTHTHTLPGPSGDAHTLTSFALHFITNSLACFWRTWRLRASRTLHARKRIRVAGGVVEASKCCEKRSGRGRKATQRESMRVQGSCRTVAGCPACVLLRAGTDTMKPAVLAGVARACLVTERLAERRGTRGAEESPSHSWLLCD